MFDPNDILIVGDSFAKCRDKNNDWPRLLVNLLTGQNKIPRGEGFSGASWWSTRKNLLNELKVHVPKVLVICHTEASRLPSDFDFGINLASAANFDIVVPNGQEHNYVPAIKKAATEYYTYLSCVDYSVWAQNSWFKELDQLLDEYKIPHVIHLHCFPPYYSLHELYCFKNGVTERNTLWELCKGVDQTSTRNHFTEEQNIKIAHAINRTLTESLAYANGWVEMNLLK